MAEVLITLAVIGVVAALTIPTLINNYQEKVTVTKLKKTYSILSNAYQLAKIDYGSIDTWGFYVSKSYTDDDGNVTYNNASSDNSRKFYDIMQNYLKVTSACLQDDRDCYRYNNTSNPRYTLNGSLFSSGETIPILNLQDGVSIAGFWWNGTIGDFAVDLNGIHGKPNTIGRDIFFFAIDRKYGLVPYGKILSVNTFANTCVSANPQGFGCTAWVIYNENLDYLKCPDELSWDGKHKCD